jgi:carboxyl-terminal processing protease
MNRKHLFFPSFLILAGLFLSACSGLLPFEEEVTSGEYGPAYAPQEHQQRTFDALWKNIQDHYIYYEAAEPDWQALYTQYRGRIDSGLTNDEFISLLNELEPELPEGSFAYQSRAERLESDLADFSTYDGIGAFVGFQEEEVPHVVVLAVIDGSPAEQAGLKAHDSIFSIDGNPILLEEGLSVVERIRGPAGSSVQLDVQSPGMPNRTVDVERARLTSTGQLEAYNVIGTDYGYLLFPPIGYEGLEQDILGALQNLTSNRKLEGLILDLRVANSSRGWPLEILFTIFHNGEIGELYDRTDTQPLQVQGQDFFSSQTVPLVILVGENTTGFPEIFAASLQMHERAIIVGAQTTGQVETSSTHYLPDGSRMFVQSTSFRLPNGDEVGTNGITPDFIIDASWDEIKPDDDPVLERALFILGTAK